MSSMQIFLISILAILGICFIAGCIVDGITERTKIKTKAQYKQAKLDQNNRVYIVTDTNNPTRIIDASLDVDYVTQAYGENSNYTIQTIALNPTLQK